MAARRTFLPDADLSERQGNVVVNNDDVAKPRFETLEKRRHRGAAVVHKGLRHHKDSRLFGDDYPLRNKRLAGTFLEPKIFASSDPVQNLEADIMIRAGIFLARIPQPNDEPHETSPLWEGRVRVSVFA